jgi:hypothetical protein
LTQREIQAHCAIEACGLTLLKTVTLYHNHHLHAWMAAHRPHWRIEVKTRPAGAKGFIPLEKRWVVERSNAWHGRYRRNSKDYERKPTSSAAMIQISHIHLILNGLAPRHCPLFHYREVAA